MERPAEVMVGQNSRRHIPCAVRIDVTAHGVCLLLLRQRLEPATIVPYCEASQGRASSQTELQATRWRRRDGPRVLVPISGLHADEPRGGPLACRFNGGKMVSRRVRLVVISISAGCSDAYKSFAGIAETVEFQTTPFHETEEQAAHPTVRGVEIVKHAATSEFATSAA